MDLSKKQKDFKLSIKQDRLDRKHKALQNKKKARVKELQIILSVTANSMIRTMERLDILGFDEAQPIKKLIFYALKDYVDSGDDNYLYLTTRDSWTNYLLRNTHNV